MYMLLFYLFYFFFFPVKDLANILWTFWPFYVLCWFQISGTVSSCILELLQKIWLIMPKSAHVWSQSKGQHDRSWRWSLSHLQALSQHRAPGTLLDQFGLSKCQWLRHEDALLSQIEMLILLNSCLPCLLTHCRYLNI